MNDARTALEQAAHAARGPIALGYLRSTSPKNKERGLGIEAQRAMIQGYFQILPVEFPRLAWGDWIEEKAVSAFKLPLFRRPMGAKLPEILKAGDHLIFACLDRGFRQIKDLILSRESFEADGIAYHFVQERIDTTTEAGWLLLHVYGLLAEYEARRDSARNRAMHARRRERGLHPCGMAPLGFRWAGAPGSKNLELDPKHRATILQIVRLKEEENLGWREISDRIEAQLAATEGRHPRPTSQRQWTPRNARRCYARCQALLLRYKINDQWRQTRQDNPTEPPTNGPA